MATQPAPSLVAVDEGLWSIESSLTFVGAKVPARTTLIRLADESLLAYSPCAWSAELGAAIEPLGRVGHVVAPSLYHHLFVGDWLEAFPDARSYGVPGLREKRPDLRLDEELSDDAPAAWKDEIDQLVFRGLPMFNELEMFHRPTRTLIVCDMVIHIEHAESWKDRMILRLDGMWKRFGASYLIGLMMLANRAKSRAGVETIQRWDYDRVIPAHGTIRDTGGKDAMTKALRFLGSA